MEQFTYHYFEGRRGRGANIKGRMIRIHNKAGNRTVVFSSECRNEILSIENPKMFAQENMYTGEILIVINSEKGKDVSLNRHKKGDITFRVHSKSAVDFFAKQFNLHDAVSDLMLSENLSRQAGVLTYKIIPKDSKDNLK
ncbi:MAG: hypothetical protein HDS59_00105 [Barnesiella sp.]|nr:hypothetical protein [Barnesiella sp.]